MKKKTLVIAAGQPLVSIALPVYNGSRYLAESIASVQAQTYENWELLITDDCSTDNSLEIARGFAAKDKRIKVVKNAINSKLPRTLNACFKRAMGEFYTWTSHDNRMLPEMLQVFVDYMAKRPEISLAYADMQALDMHGNLTVDPKRPLPELRFYHNVVGAAFMYRGTSAKKVGEYDPGFFLAEDYQYWLRLGQVAEVAYIPQVLYQYRRHPASLSSTRLVDIVLKDREMRLKFRADFNPQGIDEVKWWVSLNHPLYAGVIRTPLAMMFSPWSNLAKRKAGWLRLKKGLPHVWSMVKEYPLALPAFVLADAGRGLMALANYVFVHYAGKK
jgi:glycosyltransferase involved in cell wall biosynthesis